MSSDDDILESRIDKFKDGLTIQFAAMAAGDSERNTAIAYAALEALRELGESSGWLDFLHEAMLEVLAQ